MVKPVNCWLDEPAVATLLLFTLTPNLIKSVDVSDILKLCVFDAMTYLVLPDIEKP